MGILRVYLALCVVAAHSGPVFPWRMHDGIQAVQIFFIISGFYMAMVLSSRYVSPRDFYLSRFMRIFPPFWIVLGGTFALSASAGLFFHHWFLLKPYADQPFNHNGASGLVLTALSNLTLIGQDWIIFLSHDFGRPLHFTAEFSRDASPLWHYLLVPPGWSIGLELTFYACVPYLNRLRNRWLAVLALSVLAARLFAYRFLGLDHDPWTYRFFPFEIGLFLFGMLGYRLYAQVSARRLSQRFRCISKRFFLIGTGALLLLLYTHARVVDYMGCMVGPNLGVLLTYPLWALGIPVLFFVFGDYKIDRMIGELSYPIYLVHFTVIAALAPRLTHFGFERGIGLCSALASIIVAGFFYRVVIAPIDRKRHFISRELSAARHS